MRTTKETAQLLDSTKNILYLKYFLYSQYFIEQMILNDKVEEDMIIVYKTIKSDSSLYHNYELINDFFYSFIMCYQDKGDYESALNITDEHISYCWRFFPPTDKKHAYYELLKAGSYKHLDQTSNAEKAYRKSKELYEKIGDHSAYYQTTLRNLALLYSDLDLLALSKDYSLKNLQSENDQKNRNYYNIIELNEIIGGYYLKLNMLDSALLFYTIADSIKRKELNEAMFNIGVSTLYGLAEVNFKLGKYAKVSILANELNNIFSVQKLPFNYDQVMLNLLIANTHLNQGKLDSAQILFLDSQNKSEDALGKGIYYYESVFGLAKSQFFKEDFINSNDNFLLFFDYYKRKITEASFFLSEVELQGYIEKFESVNDYLFSLGENVKKDSIVSGAYDAWLFKQGFVLNTIRNIKSIKDTDPVIQSKYEELVQAQSELSKELSKPVKFQIKLDSVMNVKNLKEKELAALSNNVAKELKQISHSDILKTLNHSEILLEFVTYKFKETPLIDQGRYGVFVLEPNAKKVNFISLCSASLLDSIAGQALDFLSVNALYDNPELVNLVWNKILPYLKDKKRIYITTSGMLNKVNISALRLNVNQTVSDLFEITYLNSSKDLLFLDRNQNTYTSFTSAVLYGDIDYTNSTSASEGIYATGTLRGLNYYDFYMTDPGARKTKWQKLKYSKAEIDYISQKLKNKDCDVKLLDRNNANENYIKSHYGPLNKNYSPELFHFSTHAYFLPQKKSKSNTDGIYTTYRRMGDFSLIQSGIVLSGANKNWSVTDSSYYDDGILTAFEISQLNLQKTKLVVLSACDTGVGEISNSEGVYGLRRAFKIAGVDKILMSLWSVADYQTMEFMNLFYENLCTKKLSPRLALCATQKTMRQKKYEPYYWAGFVLIE
ncbi:MAG: CHAT domain-containing protein [Saprospiraceae bacterium]|nr:CHAT domain-containing protein [Candidatus Brachybacter algidus]